MSKVTKVILRESVENLGSVGDLVRVSEGYARNYLLPRNLVVVASETNVRELDHHKRILEKKRMALKQNAAEFANKLSELTVTIKRKVGKGDKLFGSVSNADVLHEIQGAGFELPKNALQMKEHLKSLGVHEVPVRLHADVVAQVKVWIVKEE